MNPIFFFSSERTRWFLWTPVGLLCGVLAYHALLQEPSPYWLLASPLLALISLLAKRTERLWIASTILTILLTFTLGFNAAQLETLRLDTRLLDQKIGPVSVIGTLMRAEPLPDGARLTLKNPWIKGVEKKDRPSLVRMKVRTPFPDLPQAGTRLNLWGPLWPPGEAVMPNGYDFRRHAYFTGLGATGLSYVQPEIKEARYPPRFFWDGFMILLEEARRKLILDTYSLLQGAERDMTAALLSGTQSAIDKDTMKAMRASGLSHLLSISGVHVSMMALLVYIPLRFIFALLPWVALRLPIKKIAACAAILATTLYTLLVGADAPTVRSALMIGIVFFGIILDRQALSLRVVALAALAILLIAPSEALGPSFQMSFAAVIAMISYYEGRKKSETSTAFSSMPLALIGKTYIFLKEILITSLIATAATTPFTLYHFQTFSFYGVLANMIAIPLTSFWVMPCLLLTYITAPFNLDSLFIHGAGLGVKFIIAVAHAVSSWPLARIPFPPMPVWALFFMVGGGLWLCLLQGTRRYIGILLVLAGLAFPLFSTTPSVMLSAEKPMWAVQLDNKTMVVFGARQENFTTVQWQQRMIDATPEYYIGNKWPDYGTELSCSGTVCTFNKGTTSIAFTLPEPKQRKKKGQKDEPAPPASEVACPAATIVIAYLPVAECPSSTTVITAQERQQNGSYAITFHKNNFIIEHARTPEARRPWSLMIGPAEKESEEETTSR